MFRGSEAGISVISVTIFMFVVSREGEGGEEEEEAAAASLS